MRRLARLAALLGLLLLAPACGWHAGLKAPEGADTLGIEWADIDDDILERDLEPALQEALGRAVVDLLDLRLVAPSQADLVLSARLRNYQRRGGIRGEDHTLVETAVRIAVEAELRRRGSGELVSSARASVPSGYVTADLVADPLGALGGEPTLVVGGVADERRARDRALRILAEGMVLDLFANAPAALEPLPGPGESGAPGVE